MKILNLITALCLGAFASEFNLNTNDGAINNFKPLKLEKSMELNLGSSSPATGLDYDNASDTFLLATLGLELYTMDGQMQSVKSHLKSTKDWIIQMEDGISAAFYGESLGLMSYNKTYEFFKHNPEQSKDEANKAWRYLLDGYDSFSLDFKDRYYTVRAKQQYILSWDHSSFYGEFFIASVPDDIKTSWSIASFSDSDNMLSTEFVPKFDTSLEVKEGRDINDYYITGMDANGEYIYLLSKQYSSVLKLDPRSRKVVDVYGFSGLHDPRALAIKDGKFYILSREKGLNKVAIFSL